jgi:hypothetical protein
MRIKLLGGARRRWGVIIARRTYALALPSPGFRSIFAAMASRGGGGALVARPCIFLNLARGDAHDMDGVADHVGRPLLVLLVPSALLAPNGSEAKLPCVVQMLAKHPRQWFYVSRFATIHIPSSLNTRTSRRKPMPHLRLRIGAIVERLAKQDGRHRALE